MASQLDGKKIVVFYEDGTQRVSRKDGICTLDDSEAITLDNRILISKNRIVRIEVV